MLPSSSLPAMSTQVHPSDRTVKVSPGFTLIELLVAVSVLVLLLLLVMEIVQSGTLVIGGSRKHLAADAEAREMFNRFAIDLAGMIRRADMDAVFTNAAGTNAAMIFYSESPGFFASGVTATNRSPLSLIGYRVKDAKLERLGKGLAWTGNSDTPVYLTYATNNLATNSTPVSGSTITDVWGTLSSSNDPDYHLQADGVFRFAFCFRKKDGTYSLTLPTDPVSGAFSTVSSVVLTLAVLDDESRKIVKDTSKLATALDNPTEANMAAGTLPGKIWQENVADAQTFASKAGIPVSAASRVRIYQRSFPLNTP